MSTATRESRAASLRRIVDDVITGRDAHGMEARVARDLQLAAAALSHDRMHRLLVDLAELMRLAEDGSN